MAKAPKYFVLDTNVLLHDAGALTAFADNTVILPLRVLEELDRFKAESNELGRNARRAIRTLDGLRSGGHLNDGVPLAEGGTLRVVVAAPLPAEIGLDTGKSDNRIIGAAYALKQKGERVIFVTKDINARIKADAIGVVSQDFEHAKVHFDELFAGWRPVTVPAGTVDEFYAQKFWVPGDVDLAPNEFVRLEDETNPKHSALGRFDSAQGKVLPLAADRNSAWSIRPRSAEQRMALDLLLEDGIQLVTLVGQAGTGKTLLALAAALQMALRASKYEKILVTRPIMPLGRDIGYLPGSMEDKISHWMLPIFDNLTYLLSSRLSPRKETANDLLSKGLIELEALTYIRGRSIADQFVIVDEAQNLTPHEIKTIVSRAGEGSKMVLTGDPYQIDNPYLDSSSNGLTYAADRLKDSPITGHITLTHSERSPLASLAAEKL